jgi:uncharacterized protein (DUF3820 family)
MSQHRREAVPPRSQIVLLPFGKHKGESITCVAAYDRGYLEWLVDQNWPQRELRDAIAAILPTPSNN